MISRLNADRMMTLRYHLHNRRLKLLKLLTKQKMANLIRLYFCLLSETAYAELNIYFQSTFMRTCLTDLCKSLTSDNFMCMPKAQNCNKFPYFVLMRLLC